jgi:lipopolysaccharide assembly outer membrane protein LptD (OstA)
MEVVHSVFYFKDDTILNIWSDKGVYNNKTLDMKFRQNVKAKYMESNLFAEKADYSNSKNYLSVYENVRLDDIRGNLIADKLIFDIVKKKLDITSFQNGKINANLKLNEKRF